MIKSLNINLFLISYAAYYNISTDCSKGVLLLRIIYVISVLYLLNFCAGLFIDALWSPAGKGLTYWLSFMRSNCEVDTLPLEPCVRCVA